MYIEGNDLGDPNQPATNNATVQVSVDRNLFPPEFLQTPYVGTVDRNSGNGTIVDTIVTRDNDTVVSWMISAINDFHKQCYKILHKTWNRNSAKKHYGYQSVVILKVTYFLKLIELLK